MDHLGFITNENLCSKKTAMTILDKVNEDHARNIIASKVEVEDMYINGQRTEKGLKVPTKPAAFGFCLFGDNVGKIINPR